MSQTFDSELIRAMELDTLIEFIGTGVDTKIVPEQKYHRMIICESDTDLLVVEGDMAGSALLTQDKSPLNLLKAKIVRI